MQRAQTIAEIKKVLSPKPLSGDELDAFFVETALARDPVLSRRKELADLLSGDLNDKVLVYGHSGSGKSTELIKFAQEHEREYQIVHLSVAAEQIQHDVRIETLLVLIAEATLKAIKEHDELAAEVNDKNLEPVYAWFSDALEYTEDETSVQSRAEVGVDSSQTWLAKLWGVIAIARTDIRAGGKRLHQTIERKQHRLSELVRAVDGLLREVKLALSQARGGHRRDLLLVVEDLDKASIRDARRLFIENPNPLVALSCKAVYTAPLFLFFSAEAAQLDGNFSRLSIPMLKVVERDGRPSTEGRRLIGDILARRLDTDVLVEPGALDLAIAKTGGVLRHLFDVLLKAALVASNANPVHPQLTTGDVRYGLNRLKSDLLQRISPLGLPDSFGDITVEQLYERLEQLKDRRKRVKADRLNLVLLQAHAIVEYNGEGWHCLHPLIDEYVGH